MKRHWMGVLALASSMAIAATPQTATAQRVAKNVYHGNGAIRPTARYASAAQPQAEELPPGTMRSQQVPPGDYGDPFVDEPYGPDGYYPHGGYDDGYSPDECYGTCGQGCGSTAPRGGSLGCGASSPSGLFFIADYLYVRASFSEAVAFMTQDVSQQGLTTLDVNQLDFQYNSSYRFGGGVTLGECCNQHLRFLYTRFTSDAEANIAVDEDIFIPYEVAIAPGVERALIDGDVDFQSYDLEYSKTILLGGEQCCQCGELCGGACGGGVGCSDSCAPRCPAWDLTWSGGIRVANAQWARNYIGLDDNDAFVRGANIAMDFEGVGPKIGLEGRRYFFENGSLSMYLKGDISLLGGELELDIVRTTEGGTAPDTVVTQSIECRHIIPVTELEAGLSGQITCNSRLTGGYLLSAWHDLGFRDEFDVLNPNFPIRYDDANILGFDGFFARFEWNY